MLCPKCGKSMLSMATGHLCTECNEFTSITPEKDVFHNMNVAWKKLVLRVEKLEATILGEKMKEKSDTNFQCPECKSHKTYSSIGPNEYRITCRSCSYYTSHTNYELAVAHWRSKSWLDDNHQKPVIEIRQCPNCRSRDINLSDANENWNLFCCKCKYKDSDPSLTDLLKRWNREE